MVGYGVKFTGFTDNMDIAVCRRPVFLEKGFRHRRSDHCVFVGEAGAAGDLRILLGVKIFHPGSGCRSILVHQQGIAQSDQMVHPVIGPDFGGR